MNAFKYPPAHDPNRSASSTQLLSRKPFPTYPHPKQVAPSIGLVVSGDSSVRRILEETLLLCGTTPVLAVSIQEAAQRIRRDRPCLGICQDRLPDGKYEELLLFNRAVGICFPWIVVSRTGDWPEYLAAIEFGAYDFLAYPPVHGELSRMIRSLLETPIPAAYS